MINLNSGNLDTLGGLTRDYKLVLCDLFGVIHNGVEIYKNAIKMLEILKCDGKAVVFFSNGPRRASVATEKLLSMGLPSVLFDDMITSGEIFFEYAKDLDGRIYYIGKEADRRILNDTKFMAESNIKKCQYVLVSDTPENRGDDAYHRCIDDLNKMLGKVRVFCINPDIFCSRGGLMCSCAGKFAMELESYGYEVEYFGKPHSAIYDFALSKFNFAKNEILAIGDNIATDAKGACDYCIDYLFSINGVNTEQTRQNPEGFLESMPKMPIATIDMDV